MADSPSWRAQGTPAIRRVAVLFRHTTGRKQALHRLGARNRIAIDATDLEVGFNERYWLLDQVVWSPVG